MSFIEFIQNEEFTSGLDIEIAKIYAIRKFKNGCFESRLITFEYQGKRSDAILKLIHDNKGLQDRFLIDHDTGCNITFDYTVELKGGLFEETKKGFLSDQSAFTYSDFEIDFYNWTKKDNFLRFVSNPKMRFHYSKSGKAFEYLKMEKLIDFTPDPDEKTIWNNADLYFDRIVDRLVRNQYNEVVYI